MQRTQVWSLVRELRSHKWHSTVKKRKKERKKTGSFESKTAILGNEYHVKSERKGEVEDEPRLLACFSQRYYNTFQKELRNWQLLSCFPWTNFFSRRVQIQQNPINRSRVGMGMGRLLLLPQLQQGPQLRLAWISCLTSSQFLLMGEYEGPYSV